jgi:hypothetical protein
MIPMRRGQGLLLAVLLLSGAARAETIELIPDKRASWGPTNLFAPITGLFLGGPGYWYSQREISIDTTPPGAVLDLFYVRRNFQKAYEQTDAPVTVILPPRVEADARDSITIRASLAGYRQQEVHVKVRSRETEVMIEFEPLPNTLTAVTHVYLAGRASLDFLTKEALTFRIQKADDGYSLVLTETGNSPESTATLEGVHSAFIQSLRPRQLGEDLVVRIVLTEPARAAGVEARSRQAYDPIRRLHSFSLDLVPTDGGADAVRRARAALTEVRLQDVSGCAAGFDESLREQLDHSALARALAPKGAFTDPYLRAAMKRLGEVSPDDAITLEDGTKFRASIPLELSAASSQASEAKVYLALLRRFVALLEPPDEQRETLRGLIAPEVGSARFGEIVDQAERRERACLASAG